MAKTKSSWKPGQSGNPNGRPKGLSITEMVKQALEEVEPSTKKPWKDLIVKKILLKAIGEGEVQLIKTLWNYIDGMPKQAMELSGEGGGPIAVNLIRDYLSTSGVIISPPEGSPARQDAVQDPGVAQESEKDIDSSGKNSSGGTQSAP